MLIKWNTQEDTFEFGQWFKGRVYGRRSDVSPNGELLIYFAARHRLGRSWWTAISRPPFFTALALWPKSNCLNGGGRFVDNKKVWLNHGPIEAETDPKFRPGPVKVVGYADALGGDDTVWNTLLARDGWEHTVVGKVSNHPMAPRHVLDPPTQWRKANPRDKRLVLEMSIVGFSGANSPWYRIKYRVLASEEAKLDMGFADWADWDHGGDLVFATYGRLFRLNFDNSGPLEANEIANFNDLKFIEVPPSFKAQNW
jgi:hypothetical protein